VVSSSLATH